MLIVDGSPPDRVPFSKHPLRRSDGEDAQRRRDVEDLRCGGLRRECVGPEPTGTFLCQRLHQLPLFSGQSLKELLIGGESGSSVSAVPVLLLSGEGGSETRLSFSCPLLLWTSPSSFLSLSLSVAPQTSSFLCELRRFLAGVASPEHQESPGVQLSSLQPLPPPLELDRSTGEASLARLIRSSSLTVLSFGDCCSSSQAHRGELAMPPQLSRELRRRLEWTVAHVTEVIGGGEGQEEEGAGRQALRRLGRLVDLSAFLGDQPATGDLGHAHTQVT